MIRKSPPWTTTKPNDARAELVDRGDLRFPSPGLIYMLCVPLLAGVATIRGIEIAGFNYSGILWVIAFCIGAILLVVELGIRPERRSYFPIVPWAIWLAYVGTSFAWLSRPGYLQVQYALQLAMPLLVGVLASFFVDSRRRLEYLIRAYFFSLLLMAFFVALCVVGVLSQDELDPVFVATRPLSMTAAVIGGLFMAGSNRKFGRSWLGWTACLAIAVITASRMASLAILALPVLNPLSFNPLRKMAAILVVGLVGVAVYKSPIFQERFFNGESGSASQIVEGDFDSQGRFDSWPFVLEEALKRPWFGHGVGSIQEFLPSVWDGAKHPCNDYLRVGYEFGGVGLVLFLGVMCWQLWSLGRQIGCTDGVVQQAFAGAWLGLAAFLPLAFTDNPIIYHLWYMNPVFALIGAAYSVANQEELDSEVAAASRFPVAPPWRRSPDLSREEAIS
jgi:O-antigen ligase